MSIRDDEIQRLIHYGKGLGVKIVIYNKTKAGSAAEWTIDGSLIEVYAGGNKSKTTIILDLIHELAHHIWFIHEKNRQPDLKFEEAIDRANLYQIETDAITPKHLRKKIYDVEVAGTGYWDIIYKDTNLKIPKWKVEASKVFDIWMYQVYYENGHFPKGKVRSDYYKEVQAKYKPS